MRSIFHHFKGFSLKQIKHFFWGGEGGREFGYKRLRSEPTYCLKENRNKENGKCPEIKCASAAIKICSGKFQ